MCWARPFSQVGNGYGLSANNALYFEVVNELLIFTNLICCIVYFFADSYFFAHIGWVQIGATIAFVFFNVGTFVWQQLKSFF